MTKLLMIPSGYKATKLYSVIPTDGTGDFAVTSGAGTRINSQGLIESTVANQPRLTYVNGCPKLLVEPQVTNLITHPLSFTNAYWTRNSVTIEADPTTAGSEVIQNGGFDTDTLWNKSGNAVISGGVATLNANGATQFVQQANLWTANSKSKKTYKLTYTITANTLNTGGLRIGGLSGSDIISSTYNLTSTVGTHNFYINVTGGGTENIITLYIQSAATSGLISIDNVSLKECVGFASPHVNYPTSGFKIKADVNNGSVIRTTTGLNATPYSNDIWVKRVSGTGQVNLIGVNNNDIPITLTNQWQSFTNSATSTSTSIRLGVKLANAGDEIMVAFGSLVEQSLPYSLILPSVEGSNTTRIADQITVTPPTGTTSIITTTDGVDTTIPYTSGSWQVPNGIYDKIRMI